VVKLIGRWLPDADLVADANHDHPPLRPPAHRVQKRRRNRNSPLPVKTNFGGTGIQEISRIGLRRRVSLAVQTLAQTLKPLGSEKEKGARETSADEIENAVVLAVEGFPQLRREAQSPLGVNLAGIGSQEIAQRVLLCACLFYSILLLPTLFHIGAMLYNLSPLVNRKMGFSRFFFDAHLPYP
jgi:hypothetical protein